VLWFGVPRQAGRASCSHPATLALPENWETLCEAGATNIPTFAQALQPRC